MPALSEYSNVYNTALLILKSKGFRVWLDEPSNLYFAEKNGWDFASDTPCGLLGVVSIYEYKSPKAFTEYWWKESGPDEYGDISRTAPEYTPVWDIPK